MKHSFLLAFISLAFSITYAQNLGVKLPDGTLPNTALDINGAISYREGTALTLANGVNSNIALGDYSMFRITGPTAAFSITGFAGGVDGRMLTIINATTQTMTLSHQVTSTAANQLNTGGSTINIAANGIATLIYNSTLAKWAVSATNGATSSGSSGWALTGNGSTTAGTNFVGTTDAQDLVFKANNTEGVRLATTGYVGIGTSSPSSNLHVIDVTGGSGLRIDRYNATSGPRLSMFHARGTLAVPTAVQSGDITGRLLVYGHNGTGFPTANTPNGIFFYATENHTTTANGTQIRLQTIANGNINALTRVIIDSDGEVGMGIGTNPNASLHVLDNSNYGIRVDRYNSVVLQGGPRFSLFYGRGTEASPTAVQSGDTIGRILSYAHNGTSFNTNNPIGIYFSATENHTTTASGGKIMFQTIPNGTLYGLTRMSIDHNGNVGIGTTAPSHILHITAQGRSTNSAWATTSDRRLKDIDGVFNYGLKELMAINTYRFHYKKDNPLKLPTDKAFQGVMAQELQKVMPEAVTQQADGYLTVNTDPIFWTMVNAIKDLKKENNNLKAELEQAKVALAKQAKNTEGGYYSVSYATFVVPLVNAVKELDEKSEKLKVKSDKLVVENEQLKAELARMKTENATLKASVDKNSQDIEMIKAALTKKQN